MSCKARCASAVAGAALAFSCALAAPAAASDAERIARGFAIAPVPLDLRGLDRREVGLGSYLVNTMGCADCHSEPVFAPDRDPFQGQRKRIDRSSYLAGGRAFGPFVSANLTPDDRGRPGGMTFAQFRDAIRHGADPDDPDRILQVMPWPFYRDLTTSDLRAMYAYLKAIPSLDR